jgi:hypothetical protein
MKLIKVIAKVFMSKLLTLIYNPKVFVLMPLQYICHLTLDNEIQMNRWEPFFIYDIHGWMILCLKKWSDPSNKVMMFVVVEILLKKLDFEKFFHEHLMSQFYPGTIRNLPHEFAVILIVLFVVKQKMTF